MNIAGTLYSSEYTEYDVVYTPGVVYAHRETGDLTLHIVSPVAPAFPAGAPKPLTPVQEKFMRWHREHPELAEMHKKPERRFPLIVDCPGSGWSGAEGSQHIASLVALAKMGFVAAGVSYRGTYRDNVVFPAAVQDLREAVRYLRAHADVYHIDPERVGVIGDSSGGHTAAYLALVPDDAEEFNIGENLSESAQISACCCIYAPVDLLDLVQDRIDQGMLLRPDEKPFPEGEPFEMMEVWQDVWHDDPETYLRKASPQFYIKEGMKLPPVLFIQGDEDEYIPMQQGLRFCERIRECGGRAEFFKVAGAGHGIGVWSEEMLRLVGKFFHTYLGA